MQMMTRESTSVPKKAGSAYMRSEENEPYLGLWWAVLMLILYLFKEVFPATVYSFFWWCQIYVIALVSMVAVFAVYRRLVFFRDNARRKKM